MKYIVIACLALALLYVIYESIRISRLVRVSSQLVADARPYQSEVGDISILVLGDSTAVGVGAATPETSVAGMLAVALSASVENYAKSGAVTADLAGQVELAKREQYDFALIQIGANDIIRFHTPDKVQTELEEALGVLSKKYDRIILLTAGKVGNAAFFPRPFNVLWTWHASKVRARFMETAAKMDFAYVDLYTVDDPMSADPKRYYAADGLHLTSDGYGFWFDEVRKTIRIHWPETAI